MNLNKNSKQKYRIGITLLLLIVFIITVSSSYAAINSGGAAKWSQDMADFLKDRIGTMASKSGGVLMTPITLLINAFSLIIFVILWIAAIDVGLTGASISNVLSFPFPDQIVFNKIPLLDPNFINPAKGSVGDMTRGVLVNLYSSFFVLAGTIFVIAALVIGIKLVFSSLAAEKAQYKQALNNWIFGIIMLFLVHYLLAGMFYLNEQIVEKVSENAVDKIPIKFQISSAIPIVGKSIAKFLKGTTSWIRTGGVAIDTVTFYGYGGIVLKYALQGLLGQDFISSIIFLIIIGQTFGLMITYIKRAFSCIFLGLLAPLVVAVDVIQKSLKS